MVTRPHKQTKVWWQHEARQSSTTVTPHRVKYLFLFFTINDTFFITNPPTQNKISCYDEPPIVTNSSATQRAKYPGPFGSVWVGASPDLSSINHSLIGSGQSQGSSGLHLLRADSGAQCNRDRIAYLLFTPWWYFYERKRAVRAGWEKTPLK